VYSVLVPWLLHVFPASFTLGEVMVVSQGLTLLVADTTLQLLAMVSGRPQHEESHSPTSPPSLLFSHSKSW
jgi:hypothetical protein